LRFSTKRTCMIEGCKRNIYAKRVCINHYERLKSYGILEKLNFTKDKVKPCLVYNCKSYDYEEGYCLDQLELIKEYGSPYVPRVVTYCAIVLFAINYILNLVCVKIIMKNYIFSIRGDVKGNGQT